jgi:HPt (histidine-containing phosphotransfer) domain-containing protein
MNYTEHKSTAAIGALPQSAIGEIIGAPTPSPIDRSILEMLDGIQESDQPDLVVELVGLFLDDAARQLALIDDAVLTRNAGAVKQAAHSLKGSSGSLGAHRVATWCQDLELFEPSEGWQNIPELINGLKAASAEACAYFVAERARRM